MNILFDVSAKHKYFSSIIKCETIFLELVYQEKNQLFIEVGMMELNQFVSTTIKEIIDGVLDAQKYAMDKGAYINPKVWSKGGYFTPGGKDNSQCKLEPINFDLVVTETSDGKTKAGIGVFLSGITLGVGADTSNANSAMSRIQFSVSVALPTSN